MSKKSKAANLDASNLREIMSEVASVSAEFLGHGVLWDWIDVVKDKIDMVSRSSSGSWIGYQSNIYYENFVIPKPGHHFDYQNCIGDVFSKTIGPWVEYSTARVEQELYSPNGPIDLKSAIELATTANTQLTKFVGEVDVILSAIVARKQDKFVEALIDECRRCKFVPANDYIAAARPTGTFSSSDHLAMSQGPRVPPHVRALGQLMSIESVRKAVNQLLSVCKRAASYLERVEEARFIGSRVGTNIFIGHGHSSEWKELRDFIRDRLRLPWDEFNRVSIAGISSTDRLREMLDSAAFALIMMTGEDETADGRVRARMNVIHEVGLFQGRLGFQKAIVLLEDECEEFSNIQGLGQIRFKKGEVSSKFEDIRQVLEREGILTVT